MPTPSADEGALLGMAKNRLADSLLRNNIAVGGGRRLSPKDLMSEAERLLHKTGSGMSLYERLKKDA